MNRNPSDTDYVSSEATSLNPALTGKLIQHFLENRKQLCLVQLFSYRASILVQLEQPGDSDDGPGVAGVLRKRSCKCVGVLLLRVGRALQPRASGCRPHPEAACSRGHPAGCKTWMVIQFPRYSTKKQKTTKS